MIRGSIGRLKNRLRAFGTYTIACCVPRLWHLVAVCSRGFDGQGFESLIDESEGSASHKRDKDFL